MADQTKNSSKEIGALDLVVCLDPNKMTSNGIWHGENPLDYMLPLFILQLTLVVIITRSLVFLFKPFRQPKVISEILGGIILGPSLLGHIPQFSQYVFPLKSITMFGTMANIGLIYFLFLIGVEMDINMIKQTGKKSLTIAISGMILPFIIGTFASLIINIKENNETSLGSLPLYVGIVLSATAFPVLSRILAELKLLNTDLGQMAMSAAVVNDMCAWILLVITIALTQSNVPSWSSLGVIALSVGFVLFCIFVVRPAISWFIRHTPEGENLSQLHMGMILTGVMISGFITDAIGTHAIFGAFVFGLVMPNGPLGTALVEKLEDFVSGLLLPLFFATSGLRTNVAVIHQSGAWFFVMLVIILAFVGKVAGTLLTAMYYQIPFNEGVALGLLMNTKGLIEMVVLNVGMDQNVLDNKSFAIMVIVTLITTWVITPAVAWIYKPARRFVPYKRRTIQKSKPDTELRMLACIHTPRNVPTIINLLEATYPTKKSPIYVYALHLIELTGRASAMLIVQNTRKTGDPAHNNAQAQSDHIITALENYEQRAGGVSIQPLAAISPYSTMHEDICNVAEDKRVAFIIIPFHKQQTVDGSMEEINPAYRTINQNVLANAPCSVGVLVDRGLGASSRIPTNHISHHIVVLFFGGPDDREALAYASRMADHPGNIVTILRFIAGENTVDTTINLKDDDLNDQGPLSVITDMEKEKQIDDDFLNECRLKHVSNESVVYTEKVVNNGEETVEVISAIVSKHDLYIVGRGQSMVSPLTAGLTDWSECPELGAIGDLLASSDFAATVSVLVVQQYVGFGPNRDMLSTPNSPASQSDYYTNIQNVNRRPEKTLPISLTQNQRGSWNA